MYQKNFILIVFLITLLGNAKMRQEKTELNNNYTAVAISVINLPSYLENQEISLISNYNEWKANDNISVVMNNTIHFTLNNIYKVLPLENYYDAPLDANFAFRFVNPSSLENIIKAYFATNDNNFRLKIEPNAYNEIIIDVKNRNVLIIDQDKSVHINGALKNKSPEIRIDPTLFTFPNGLSKSVILSFDDSRSDDRQLVELLNQHQLKATFNLISGALYSNNNLFINYTEVSELYKNHEVASHSFNQQPLEALPKPLITRFVNDSQDTLRKLTRKQIYGFAYPYGTYKTEVIDALKSRGYIYARTNIQTLST